VLQPIQRVLSGIIRTCFFAGGDRRFSDDFRVSLQGDDRGESDEIDQLTIGFAILGRRGSSTPHG
jgi:hypothetical protein